MARDVEIRNAEYRPAITRRLAPLYVAAALQSFVLWYAVEKPFMSEIGLRETQIAVVVIVLNVVLIVSNVPLGILADRWSRKGILMCAGSMSAFASLAGAASEGFVGYVVAIIFFGLFMAAYSGGYDSVVYDTVLEETKSGEAFSYFYGRVKIFEGVALALSSLAGGLVAWGLGSRATYLVTVPFALCSVIALAYFREPTRHHRRTEHVARARLTATLRTVVSQRHTRRVIATLIVLSVGISLMTQLDQLWLLALAVPLALYGPVNAAILASLALGGYVAGKSGRTSMSDVRFATGVLVVSCGLLFQNVIFVIVAQCVTLGGFILLSISLGQRLHAATPSDVRSSISSAVATLGTLCFAPVALLFGHLSQTTTVFRAAWIVVALAALALIGSIAVHKSCSNRGCPPAVPTH